MNPGLLGTVLSNILCHTIMHSQAKIAAKTCNQPLIFLLHGEYSHMNTGNLGAVQLDILLNYHTTKKLRIAAELYHVVDLCCIPVSSVFGNMSLSMLQLCWATYLSSRGEGPDQSIVIFSRAMRVSWLPDDIHTPLIGHFREFCWPKKSSCVWWHLMVRRGRRDWVEGDLYRYV